MSRYYLYSLYLDIIYVTLTRRYQFCNYHVSINLISFPATEPHLSETFTTPKSKSKSKSEAGKSPEVSKEGGKPRSGGILDITKFRSLVERNTLDNDRLQQKQEARKSSDCSTHSSASSRLEADKPDNTKFNNNTNTSNSNSSVDNSKHLREEAKPDNYQHLETDNGAVKRKKKKKKKSERPDSLSSNKTITSSESKSDELDCKSSVVNSKQNTGNRFSCVDGPRIPKR